MSAASLRAAKHLAMNRLASIGGEALELVLLLTAPFVAVSVVLGVAVGLVTRWLRVDLQVGHGLRPLCGVLLVVAFARLGAHWMTRFADGVWRAIPLWFH